MPRRRFHVRLSLIHILLLSVMDMLSDMGCTRVWLQVSTANESAYPLYRSVGFVQERLLSHWYEVISEGDLLA